MEGGDILDSLARVNFYHFCNRRACDRATRGEVTVTSVTYVLHVGGVLSASRFQRLKLFLLYHSNFTLPHPITSRDALTGRAQLTHIAEHTPRLNSTQDQQVHQKSRDAPFVP